MNHVDIDALVLAEGSHISRNDGVCAMEAVAWLAHEKHSDAPPCTDPTIAAYVRHLNDIMPTDQRQRLKSYIPKLIDTKLGVVPVELAFRMADRSVRVYAVAALRSAGLEDEAAQLAALESISTRYAADAASDAADAARNAADAAGNAGDAAGNAAYAAGNAAYAAGNAAYAAGNAAYAAGNADIWAEPLAMLDELLSLCVALPA